MTEASRSLPTASHAPSAGPRIVCVPALDRAAVAWLPATLTSLLSNTLQETPVWVFVDLDAPGVAACQQQMVGYGERLEWRRIATAKTDAVAASWQVMLAELLASCEGRDILLAFPGIEVPYGWDARLGLTAQQNPQAASVSPLCDSVPGLAVLEPTLEPTAPLATVDHRVRALGREGDVEIPALFGRCVYLKHAALAQIWPGRSDWADVTRPVEFFWNFSKALQFAGWHHVGCGHVYVRDREQSDQAGWTEWAAHEEIRLFNAGHSLTPLRQMVRTALAEGDQPGTTLDPLRAVQLHIAHSWGGGQERWLRDYCAGDASRLNLVLRSAGSWGVFGERLALYRSSAMDVPLRRWELAYPIRSTAIAHLRYQAILREIITDFRVETLLVSSLIGHSLDVLRTELPTVLITHDYYPYCHAINIYFQEICRECPPERLARCMVKNDQNRHFANMTPPEWLALRRHFIDLLCNPALRLVAPSASAPRHLQALIPELRDRPWSIIPHGTRFARAFAASACSNERLDDNSFRILIPGSLVLHKGRKLLETLCRELSGEVEFYLLGCGEDGKFFTDLAGVHVMAEYAREELPDLVATIKPHIGLLLSIVPETYSYTLSELWLLRIPVVATQVGGFSDRIVAGVNGFLCAPEPSALLEQIRTLRKNPQVLAELRQRLAEVEPRTPEEMVADYHALTPLPEFSRQRYFAVESAESISSLTSAAPTAPISKPSPGSHASSVAPAVLINPQARFPEVLREFQGYILNKLNTSPRFSANQRKWLSRLLRRLFRLLDAIAKRLPIG